MMDPVKYIIYTLTLTCISFISQNCEAQDIHFSLFDWQANINNPALTGINPETQLGLQYRDQGFRVSENSFRSFSFFADSYMNREVREHDHLGVGGSLVVDKAGIGNISTTEAFVNLAYHLSVRSKSQTYLSISPQVGFIQRELTDLDNFSFEEELLGGNFSEQFINSGSQYMDAGLGLALRHNLNKDMRLVVGYSLHHLNDRVGDFSELNVDKIPHRSHIHASLVYPINSDIQAESQVHFHKSRVFRELLFKQNIRFLLSGEKIHALDLGLAYRDRDALIFNAGFSFDQFDVGFAYEINSSALSQASSPTAAFELAIKYHIPFKNRSEMLFIPFVNQWRPRELHKTKSVELKPRFVSFDSIAIVDLGKTHSSNSLDIQYDIAKIDYIFFDFDKFEVKPEYNILIDQIKKLNNKYPDAYWTISAHTDSRGSSSYNKQLSQKRLMAVLHWLHQNDIEFKNLSQQPEGESMLLNPCSDGIPCSKSEHQLNRRVSISVAFVVK